MGALSEDLRCGSGRRGWQWAKVAVPCCLVVVVDATAG